MTDQIVSVDISRRAIRPLATIVEATRISEVDDSLWLILGLHPPLSREVFPRPVMRLTVRVLGEIGTSPVSRA